MGVHRHQLKVVYSPQNLELRLSTQTEGKMLSVDPTRHMHNRGDNAPGQTENWFACSNCYMHIQICISFFNTRTVLWTFWKVNICQLRHMLYTALTCWCSWPCGQQSQRRASRIHQLPSGIAGRTLVAEDWPCHFQQTPRCSDFQSLSVCPANLAPKQRQRTTGFCIPLSFLQLIVESKVVTRMYTSVFLFFDI